MALIHPDYHDYPLFGTTEVQTAPGIVPTLP